MMMLIRPSSTSSAIVRVILRGGSSSRRAAARPLPSSSFSGGGRCSLLLPTNGVNASAMELRSNRGGRLLLFSTHQYYSSSSSESLFPKQKDKQIRKAILSAALRHVHDMGWTDDAIASAVLDCNYPPSYIGRVLSSSTSSKQSSLSANYIYNDYSSSSGVWGNGQLVAHFMEECNNNLRDKLMSLPPPTTASSREGQVETNNDVMVLASHINTALQLRLSMVVPFINSQRWHEGMAIGALPQNALMTMSQLNDMADIVLSYATAKTLLDNNDVGSHNNNSMHKMAIIAAYAAAELHLLSSNVTSSSATAAMTTTSLSGDRHDDTWTFLEARSSEAAHVIINGGMFPSLLDLPPAAASTIQTASAITSSLFGAALSLASPNAASMAGRVGGGSSSTVSIVPQVLDSVIGLVQSYVGIGTTMTKNSNANNGGGGVSLDGRMKRGDAIANGIGGNKRKGDGTRPSDYAAIEESLPPFDTTEEIFGSIKNKVV
jgi:ubiquinone biosynthesis protein COQ9